MSSLRFFLSLFPFTLSSSFNFLTFILLLFFFFCLSLISVLLFLPESLLLSLSLSLHFPPLSSTHLFHFFFIPFFKFILFFFFFLSLFLILPRSIPLLSNNFLLFSIPTHFLFLYFFLPSLFLFTFAPSLFHLSSFFFHFLTALSFSRPHCFLFMFIFSSFSLPVSHRTSFGCSENKIKHLSNWWFRGQIRKYF